MTFEERMQMKDKLEDELCAEPEIQVGDTIVVPKFGIKAKIGKLYYAFRCVEWHTEKETYVKCYDVEFVDDRGNYRHWKSYFDGGYVEYSRPEGR